MTISDWAIVLAAIMGPVLAIQVQKVIERIQEKKNAKLWVFRQLMATRAAKLSREHCQALNMIDVAFYDEKPIREAWKALFDSFCRKTADQTEDRIIHEEREKLLVDLLYVMAKSLGYDFDRTDIKNQAYVPQAHGDVEMQSDFIRHTLAKMLHDDGAFRLKVVELPAEDDSQRKFREALTELYLSGKPWPVRIVQGDTAILPVPPIAQP